MCNLRAIINLKTIGGYGVMEQMKNDIKEMVDGISNIWILDQIKMMIQNITR